MEIAERGKLIEQFLLLPSRLECLLGRLAGLQRLQRLALLLDLQPLLATFFRHLPDLTQPLQLLLRRMIQFVDEGLIVTKLKAG